MTKELTVNDLFKKEILSSLGELKGKTIKDIYDIYGQQSITVLTEDNCYLYLEFKTVSDGYDGWDNIIWVRTKEDIIKDIEVDAYSECDYLFEDEVLDYELYRIYVDEIQPNIEEELRKRELEDRITYIKNQIMGMNNELKELESKLED